MNLVRVTPGGNTKKCCGDPKRLADVGCYVPPQMRNVVKRMRQMHGELRPLRMTSRPQIQADFNGQKARAVRNRIYLRPLHELFHQFLVNHLLWILGQSWFNEDIKKPPAKRHVVLQWRDELLHIVEQARQAQAENPRTGGAVDFAPTGNVQALLVLADDVYQVEHATKTPKPLIRRLRDHQHFQGARYEIAAASIVARCGFEIEFIKDKTKKMPEFYASKKAPPEKLAVEAKSRHRAGVLHEPGPPPDASALKADVERLLHEALRQNPGGMPFFAFIDLNLPLTPGAPTEQKPWFKDLKDIFDRVEAAAPEAQDDFTAVVFTNFGWHYSREKGAPGGEYLMVTSNNTRHPVSAETLQLLKRALDEYGFIPDEEAHEKEVRARYPEFQNS